MWRDKISELQVISSFDRRIYQPTVFGYAEIYKMSQVSTGKSAMSMPCFSVFMHGSVGAHTVSLLEVASQRDTVVLDSTTRLRLPAMCRSCTLSLKRKLCVAASVCKFSPLKASLDRRTHARIQLLNTLIQKNNNGIFVMFEEIVAGCSCVTSPGCREMIAKSAKNKKSGIVCAVFLSSSFV